MKYYETIFHTNTVDTEQKIFEITSKEEEKYQILNLRVLAETNGGIMRFYHEREKFGEVPTGVSTISNFLIYEINRLLNIGETFRITLQNRVSGTNAVIRAVLEYEIV